MSNISQMRNPPLGRKQKRKPKKGVENPSRLVSLTPQQLLDRVVVELHAATSTILPGYTGLRTGVEPSEDLKSRMLLANPSQLADFRDRRSRVAEFYFGTQMPELVFSSAMAVFTAVAGVANGVLALGWSQLNNTAQLTVLFDEYQFRHLDVHLFPGSELYNAGVGNTNLPLCLAVIDFDSSGSLVSVNQAVCFDTARVFAASAGPTSSKIEPVTWQVGLVGIPDMQWTTTATSTTPAWLKVFNFSGSLANQTVGYAYFRATMRFRQIVSS